MYKFCKRLKALKPNLRPLNKTSYSDIHQRVVQAHEMLLALQNEYLLYQLKILL